MRLRQTFETQTVMTKTDANSKQILLEYYYIISNIKTFCVARLALICFRAGTQSRSLTHTCFFSLSLNSTYLSELSEFVFHVLLWMTNTP